jgi:hypothetical protein
MKLTGTTRSSLAPDYNTGLVARIFEIGCHWIQSRMLILVKPRGVRSRFGIWNFVQLGQPGARFGVAWRPVVPPWR